VVRDGACEGARFYACWAARLMIQPSDTCRADEERGISHATKTSQMAELIATSPHSDTGHERRREKYASVEAVIV